MRTKLIYFIDYVHNKMSLLFVSIIYFLLSFLSTFLGQGMLNILFSGYFFAELDLIVCVALSFIVSAYAALAVYLGRKSDIFWNAVHDFQGDLNEAKTKQDIISLKGKYDQLKELSTTSTHAISKLNEFKAVMQTKLELLPD